MNNPLIRFIKFYHNTSVMEIKSLHDCNRIWRWDMDSSDSHIFKRLLLTFCSICKQPITLLAKIKLIQEHVIVPITKRKIVYFEKNYFRHIFCTWDWFKLRTIKKSIGRDYSLDTGEDAYE